MTPFGYYLSTLRRSRNLQQKGLAKLLQVDPCYISMMENGKKGPPADDVIEKLIHCLSLSEDEQVLLREYISQSQRRLALPDNMTLQEYALVRSLWKKLGALSPGQIEAINSVLKISEERSGIRSLAQLEWRAQSM